VSLSSAQPALQAVSNLRGGALKRAYRELAVLVHPDKYSGDKALASEAFSVLTAAYEALTPLVQG
jgi:hypothetical protein